MSLNNIFVYGSLKKDCRDSYLLKDQRMRGDAVLSASHNFRMVNLGRFPAILSNQSDEISQDIFGEVWEVDPFAFEKIDDLADYPNFFSRKEVILDIGKLSKINHFYLRCWVYFIDVDNKNEDEKRLYEYGDMADLLSVPKGDW